MFKTGKKKAVADKFHHLRLLDYQITLGLCDRCAFKVSVLMMTLQLQLI